MKLTDEEIEEGLRIVQATKRTDDPQFTAFAHPETLRSLLTELKKYRSLAQWDFGEVDVRDQNRAST